MNEQNYNSLPEQQRIAAQKRLIELGLYAGKADGKFGAGTKAAFEQEAKQKAANEAASTAKEEKARSDKLEADRLAIELAKVTRETKSSEVADAATKAETARKAAYDEAANSALGMAAQSAGSVGAPALAGIAGLRFGDTVNRAMDQGQEKRNVTLRGAADDRVKGLTTREGAVTGSKLAGAMPPTNALLRVGGRMAPHAGLAALSMGKGASLLSSTDENQPFYPRMADRAAGLGYIGFGGGILKRGIQQAQSPGVSPDAQALSVINSSQLRRGNNTADAAAPATPRPVQPGSRADLMSQAKRYGVKGRTNMNVDELRTAVGEAVKTTPALRGGAATKMLRGMAGPVGAAALAYGMTPDQANAADGSSTGGQSEALTNAGVAGGIAYGANRLLGRAAGPAMAGLTAYDNASESQGYRAAQPPEVQDTPGGTIMAHAMPLAMRGAQDIASIARAPGQIADAMSGHAEQGGSTMAGFEPPEAATAQSTNRLLGLNAASLKIPEGIQLPRPDGLSPYAYGSGSAPGMTTPGNIDLSARPRVRNADGSISTVRSMSANLGNGEVLMPTVSDDGRIMSDDEAVDQYRRTGRQLGTFDTPENANAYAENLHNDQAQQYADGGVQNFESQLAELQALLAEAGQSQAQEAPQVMPTPPAYAMSQNRLLGGSTPRY